MCLANFVLENYLNWSMFACGKKIRMKMGETILEMEEGDLNNDEQRTMMFGGDEEDRGGEGHGSRQDKALEVFQANM